MAPYPAVQSAASCLATRQSTVLARFLTRTQGRIRNRLLLTTSGKCFARVASSHPIHASRLAIRHAGLENCTQATTFRCGCDAYTKYRRCAPNGTVCPR